MTRRVPRGQTVCGVVSKFMVREAKDYIDCEPCGERPVRHGGFVTYGVLHFCELREGSLTAVYAMW